MTSKLQIKKSIELADILRTHIADYQEKYRPSQRIGINEKRWIYRTIHKKRDPEDGKGVIQA